MTRPGWLAEVLQAAAPPEALFVFPAGGPRPDLLTRVLWFAGTRAVRPLHTLRVDVHEPETYPSGV